MQEQNVFDSKKKIKVAMADNLRQKLTRIQRHFIAINQCLLHMYTNQVLEIKNLMFIVYVIIYWKSISQCLLLICIN